MACITGEFQRNTKPSATQEKLSAPTAARAIPPAAVRRRFRRLHSCERTPSLSESHTKASAMATTNRNPKAPTLRTALRKFSSPKTKTWVTSAAAMSPRSTHQAGRSVLPNSPASPTPALPVNLSAAPRAHASEGSAIRHMLRQKRSPARSLGISAVSRSSRA